MGLLSNLAVSACSGRVILHTIYTYRLYEKYREGTSMTTSN